MSAGGGFRGRGFGTRGHRRQGFDGSGGPNARPNRHDSRGGTAGLQGPMGSRSGFRGVGSRSNVQSDGKGLQGGGGTFRGDGICGPRKNFNSPRGPPMHQAQQPDGNWSGNNWSGNNWTDQNMGNNWSDNNMGNNWASNDCANNWSDNNPGNHWSDNNPGNNWSDNNLGNNWSGNNPCNNWSPRGARPPRGGFPAWGAPTRFNSPPIPPFYRSPGQNTFGPYRFPPPLGTNYLSPSVVDFPSTPDTEPQNTQKPPTNPGPKATHPKKPSKPEKQIIHPGSEEERLQKITEAADKLKRTLSTIKKAPETWYNDDDGGALEFSQQDPDHEPRIANRGIPELKHDPPELDLTLNDLRDIGRVDHDHTTRTTKSSNDPDQNIDESEVEILEHNPVQRVPEATIDIDLWPEDNPENPTQNQSTEPNDIIDASKDFSEPSQTFLDTASRTDYNDTVSNPENLDSQCNDETSTQESNKQQNAGEIPRDPERVEEEKTVKENTQNINLDIANSENCPISKSDQNTIIDDDFQGKTKNSQTIKIQVASARDTEAEPESTASNKSQEIELSRIIENEQIGDDLQNYANSKTTAAFAVTDESKETSNETNIFDENKATKEIESIGSISDERIETTNCVPVKESRNDKIVSLTKRETAKISAGAADEVASDEGAENSQEKDTIKSDKVATSDDAVQNENETFETCSKSADALKETSDEAKPVKRDENIIKTTSDSVSNEETMNAAMNQSENETKEKDASTDKSYSRSQSNDRDSIEIRANVNANIDPQARKKADERSLGSSDLDIGEHRQEESPKTKTESKSLQERSQTASGPDGKSQERRKLVRTAYNNFCSRNRKSTPDPASKNVTGNDSQSSTDDGALANAPHTRTHRNQSPLSSNFENLNYASSSSEKRPKEESSPVLIKLNRRLQSMVEAEDSVQSVLPPAFDPRLSSRERSVLMSSSMPIQQDFTIASGYPSRTMTNLVPSVAAMNYGVPVGVPPPASTTIKPTSNIPPICIPDPFVPILPLANVPIVPPMVLPNELMLQPPLPVELPPPPPPPQKQTINMEAELEDMQEAMEFAKQLMNMNDSMEPAPDDLLDADIADESGFFHMPTFPDLPPIELPPALPAETNPMKNVDAKQPANKECIINSNRGTKLYGPAVMSEEYRSSPTQSENTVESSVLTEEQLRPKVVFNLNARSKMINKHDEWHQQSQREQDSEVLSSFVPTTAKKTSTEIAENRKITTNPASPMLVTKERSTNGHEDRKKRDERPRSTRYNGKIDSLNFSRSNKSLEDSMSRSPTPPKHGTQPKSAKRDDEHPRNNRAMKSDVAKRSSKETTSRKSGNDPQTPESSWKSRVIGRFLKMSKNDIGNMLNNASLRKFDIAMKHLVKERRSSLSLGMRNTEEERMKDAELSYNREEFMDQLSAMLDPSATVDVCNLPTQFIHHLSEVLHLDTMSEFDSSQTMSETLGDVSSPATQSSPNSESRKQVESREIPSARQTEELYEKNHERKRRREKPIGGPEIATTTSPGTSLTTTPTGSLETWKVSRAIDKPTGENSRTESVENRAIAGPRSKRRRVRAATSEQQSTTRGNSSLTENDSSSLNMADLDDIFSAGIARVKKKSHDFPILTSGGRKRDKESLNVEENSVPIAKDPSVDRVERAVVELDEIFTAGIARAKLASKKVSEIVKPVEMFAVENDERVWNPGSLRTSLDSHRIREKSSPSGKKASKVDKWSRHVHYEEPVAFRNLTKEEWEAKYSEPSYSAYQREYGAMEALREERSRCSPSCVGKPDYNAFDINDLGSAKSRLGEPVTATVEYHEDWSGSDELSRGRDIDEAMNYTVDYNCNSGVESSSTSSSSSSSSSDNEDNEASTLSVTKLLKVIKEREKIAKQKSFNEEIRDEVTAEIERQKRDREKHRKRHRPKAKKSSHHRRKKDKRGKVRERKKRDRKRKKRKSRRSDGGSKGNSDDEVVDEEYFSSSSRGRHPSRLLNENEIKKEIKEEPDAAEAGPTEKTTAKSCTSSKSPDDSRPASTTSFSSAPSIVPLPSASQSVAHQTKTKAQLKQMPAVIKKRVATVTNVNEEIAKNKPVQANEDTRENIVTKSLPVDPETPNVSIESDNPTIPSVPTVTTAAALVPQTSAACDGTPLKTNSKKLDIKTYKERARQRQLRQNEKICLSSENPGSLTQNILNIPVGRKNEVEAIDTNVNEPPRDPRLKKVQETSVEMSFDEKLNNETPTAPVVSASSSTEKISTSSNAQENVSPPEVVRKKIIRPPLTPAQLSKEPQPIAKDPSADLGKFSRIKSEGRKEMKLREKLIRGRPRTGSETSETSGPPKVPPTRLNRRRSLVTTEKILSATELKTNQVPSTSVLDATSISRNFEIVETTKSSNETSNPNDNEKILSASETSNSVESFDRSENVTTAKIPEPPTNVNKTQSLDVSKPPTKSLDEPKIPDSLDTLNETVVSSSPDSNTLGATETFATPGSTSASIELTAVAHFSTTAEIFDGPKPRDISKSPDDSETRDSSRSESMKNPKVPIQPDTCESVNFKGELGDPETLDPPRTLTNLQDSAGEEFSENSKTSQTPTTLKNPENCETPRSVEGQEALMEESEKPDCETCLEKPTGASETTGISDDPESSNLSEKLMTTGKLAGSENQVPVSVPEAIEKDETILTNETGLIALEMPIEELTDWSLDAPAISSNIPEPFDYSNDSVPFKGFTEEAILRRDRVLTEAEITEDSELNTFESVPLNFVSEAATSTTGNIDLEEITSTDVVDSLDSLPLTYSEQFPNPQDEIDASLPDPLGHTIFTMASEIVDDPVAMSLEPLQTFAADEATEKPSEPQEQPMEVEDPAAECNEVERLTTVHDFLVDDVNTRETVPSPILAPDANGSKEPSMAEATKSTSDEIDKVAARSSPSEVNQEATLFEESSTEQSNVDKPVATDELRPSEVENSDANAIAVEKNIRSEMEPSSRAPNSDHDVERSEVRDVDLEPEVTKEIEAIESSQKSCEVKVDGIEQSVSGTNEEAAKKEKAGSSSTSHQEKLDLESKSKDSPHHSKEHSHGKVKKKSSRYHNHGSKTSKKTTLTEKLVEDAITANVVKLVAKPNSRQTVMARMMEIDVEIHKLMNEKMTLYKMLESGDFTSNENQDCVDKIVDDTHVPNEKEKDAEASQARGSASAIPKATEEPTKKPETKSPHSEVEDKSKKRKKSPHRESKHRSREPDTAQPRRERKPSESKSHTSRITLSEETMRQESGLNRSREKSTSWTDLEDAEDRRRKKEETPTHKSSKRYDQHSSREDLLEVPRDPHKADKSTKSDSTKRQKPKKSVKAESKKSDSRWGSREGQSAPEKETTTNSDNIYSDDSNLELQEPHDSGKNNEASGNKDHVGSSPGLTLLEESLKREKAHHRKIKTREKRKKKHHELRRSLLNATVLTANEAKTGLMNLFERRKLHRQENAATSGSKDKTRSRNPGKVSKHVSIIIDAVASNRVEELYTENSRTASGDDGARNSEVPENRAFRDEGNEERIDREEQEQITVPKTTDDLTSRIKKVDRAENVEKSEQKESQEEKEDSNQKGFHNREDSPVTSEPEILEIPKTPDIAEEDLINLVSATTQKIYISDAELASKDKSVKNLRTESRSEEENEQEKRMDVVHRSRSVTPEYPEPSSLDSKEQTNRRELEQLEDSDARLADETLGEGKRGVRIMGETTEKNDAVLDDEDDDEIIPRSRSRANARRTKRRGKSRSRTRKDRRSHHRDTRDPPSRQGYVSDENDQEDVSLRRPRSATSRKHKHREKAGPPSRRGSRQSDENVKSTRGRKREHERSNSRGLSPHDSEPARKRSHSHRSVTPTILPTTSDQQSNKKGNKRKRPGEMSVEEMMRCRVELIDCKYTYLSPTMHPKILKKLGISRINRYVASSEIIGNWSPPVLTRNETPSPPTLSKAFEAEYSRKELDDIIEKIEIPERLEGPISTGKIVEEERIYDNEEEIKETRVRSPMECLAVKDHVDDVDEEEDEDDEDDDNIQIVKVLDDSLPITPQGHEDDDVRSVKDMDNDEFSRIDANENGPEVIAVEGDYDTTEEYEVIDEVTDENEEITEETNNDVQVVEPSRAVPPVTENSTEREELFEPDNNDNESEPRRTRYTVHKGPILDIKVLEDSFLAASEDGAIYRYSQTSNGILNIYKGHEAAVTCIYVLEMPGKRWNLYSGSLDGTFRCYDITTGAQDRSANIGSPVQCMDQGWGTIYIGTKSGHISRYSIKSTSLKGDRLEFSDKSVLALKASAEGPRRVLIVASRNQPITIRDANTGLFLRTICGYKNHTVYSLMRDRNLVYCGTSSTSIPVYDFTNGEQVTQYNAGVGIVCMRLYRQILFAGCYDGHIYVFDTLESKLLCSIPGPGNMLLSMEVVNDEIIAGSKNRQLHSWRMPKGVRALLAERT